MPVNDDEQDAPSLRQSIFELGGVALLLVLWMGALYRLTGLPDAARLPAWPGWDALAAMATSRYAPLDGVLQVTIVAQWAIAAGLAVWLVLSVVLELLLMLAERGPARGSAWLRGARTVVRQASFPLVHQVVATLFALQLVVRPPSLAFAQAARPTIAQTVALSQARAVDDEQTPDSSEAIWHTVQRGETVWAIAERYYGDGAEYERIVEANVDRPMGGRTFSRAAVIYPGDLLNIPLPSMAIEEHDGQRLYVVEPGDTLDGIAARLLGDPARSPEIFELNAGIARMGTRGPVLTNADLIWPGLRLRLPSPDTGAVEPADEPSSEAATQTPAVTPVVGVAPDRQDHLPAAPVVSIPPTLLATAAATPATSETPPPFPTPAVQPPEQVRTEPGRPISPEAAALGAAGLAAAALAAGYLRVYKRRPGRDPAGPESDVRIEDGFAETDPVDHLARRLARSSDPEAAIASLLGQAYAAIFDEQLPPEARREASEGISVAATRHGRTSTTLVLSAPVAARPHLVHCMRAAAERAFGEQVDVDGQVGQDGDVLVRVTWDPRRPIAGHLLELVNASASSSIWPAPHLVPALVLRDRQHLAINWHTVNNVLVAAPTGLGADVPLTALVAALASVWAPEDLGLVVIARPHTLPDEVCVFPHGLMDTVDPGDPEAVRLALESVKLEVDRRRETGSTADADLVVVVRELGDLESDALEVLAAITATGPDYGVRLLAASEQPIADLLGRCPFFDQLGTRLVLQAATEEDSVALLGMPGAEDLGAGGLALLRLEGRLPVQ
ncbi:MAG TPA: LysM peptidoglycan-binding domain-containing protein, partial [Roseiflexaceae bacterium]